LLGQNGLLPVEFDGHGKNVVGDCHAKSIEAMDGKMLSRA